MSTPAYDEWGHAIVQQAPQQPDQAAQPQDQQQPAQGPAKHHSGGILGFFKSVGSKIAGAVQEVGSTIGNVLHGIPVVRDVMHYTGDVAKQGLEELGKVDRFIYTEAVSRPLSTAFQMANQAFQGQMPDPSLDWKRSNYISPGQALEMLSPAGKVVNMVTHKDPNRIDLNDPAAVKRYFDSGYQQFYSGAADLATNWFLDPLVVGGKAVKVARAAGVISHSMDMANAEGKLLKQGEGVYTTIKNAAGKEVTKPTVPVSKIMESGVMDGAFSKFVERTKGMSPADLVKLPSFAQATNPGALATAYAHAADDAERVHVLRVAMGDRQAYAQMTMKDTNSAQVIKDVTDNWSAGANPSRFDIQGPNAAGVLQTKLDDAGQRFADLNDKTGYMKTIEDLTAREKQLTDVFGTMDNLRFGATSGASQAVRGFVRNRTTGVTGIDDKGNLVGHGLLRNSIYERPMVMLRSIGDKHPNGYVDLESEKAYQEIQAELRSQSKLITPDEQNQLLSTFLKASNSTERRHVAEMIDHRLNTRLAQKYGMSLDDAETIAKRYGAKKDAIQSHFSAAKYPDPDNPSATRFADDFTGDGTAVMAHPNMVSKMADSHIWTDRNMFERSLKLNASTIEGARAAGYKLADLSEDALRGFDNVWKMGAVMRVNNIVRNVTDDLLSQYGAMGGIGMMSRVKDGTRNFLANNFDRLGTEPKRQVALAYWTAHKQELVAEKEALIKDLESSRFSGASGRAAQRHQELTDRLGVHTDLINEVDQKIADLNSMKATRRLAGDQSTRMEAGGQQFRGTFEGAGGQILQRDVSGDIDSAVANLYKDGRSLVKRQLASGWHLINATDPGHMDSWVHDITHQIANDPLAMMAAKGRSPEEMETWLRTAAGKQHMAQLDAKRADPYNLASAVHAEVNQYLLMQSYPEISQFLVQHGGRMIDEGELRNILKAVPEKHRPEIHSDQLELSRGMGSNQRIMDRIQDWYYNTAVQVPLENFSRHPFANQVYMMHRERLARQALASQGGKLTNGEVNLIEQRAGQLARRDVSRYSFDLAHRSEAAYALRHIIPFGAATQEALTRYARVVYDQPQAAGKYMNLFMAPAKAGILQDRYGNKINADGTVTMPDGSKRLVPQNERFINARIPKFLQHGPFAGQEHAIMNEGALNLVLQGDYPLNPGEGPLVQIATSQIAQNRPDIADALQKYGVLPVGPTYGWKGALSSMLPNWLQKVMNSDDNYASQALAIYNNEMAKYHNGERNTMPNWDEVDKKAKEYWMWQGAMAAFAPTVASVKPEGKYAYLKNEYNRLIQQNGGDVSTAKDQFWQKYGDDLMGFTASTTKLNVQMPATMEAFRQYAAMNPQIAKDPEVAGILMGPDTGGNFNQSVYQWQLHHKIGGELIREKITPKQAIQNVNADNGWRTYNRLTTKLDAMGIEQNWDGSQLRQAKSELAKNLTDPANPMYNEDWAKQYETYDRGKYQRMIPHLEKLVSDPAIQSVMDVRTDLKGLYTYLQGRRDVNQELKSRGASGGDKSLSAQSNSDLAQGWNEFVTGLLEKDLGFEALYNRFLFNDMGTHVAVATPAANGFVTPPTPQEQGMLDKIGQSADQSGSGGGAGSFLWG